MIVIFGIRSLKFAEMQKIVQNNNKKTIFGPKISYLGILGCRFEKLLSYFQHPLICQNTKFRAK